jgi:hypothetical protein
MAICRTVAHRLGVFLDDGNALKPQHRQVSNQAQVTNALDNLAGIVVIKMH